MNVLLNFYVDLSIVMISMTAAVSRWKRLELPAKLFFMNIVCYFIAQGILEGAILYRKLGVFQTTFYYTVRNLEPIVTYSLGVLFFHFAIAELKKKKIAMYLLPLGVILWITCMVVFRDLENSLIYFMPFSNIVMIILGIFSLNDLMNSHDMPDLKRMPVFWFTTLQLFYYCGVIFFSISYSYLITSKKVELFAIYFLFRLNDAYYVGAALTYFFYRKKIMQLE